MSSEPLGEINRRVGTACARAGRDPSSVTIVAVSKTFPAEAVRRVVEAGVTDVGENYVQELTAKRDALLDLPVRWHFIGHLQSNKARAIAGWIHLVHALDSESLARELERQAQRAGRSIDVLLEVNTTGESSKFGVRPGDLLPLVRSLAPYGAVRVCGLMTIGPFLPDPEGSRPMFRHLRVLGEQVAQLGQENVSLRHLSMGMSGDFEVAIDEGATIIRLGTAIFGSRRPSL